jgi:hypothetical protein
VVLVRWVAVALVALAGCAAAVGLLVVWLAMHAPAEDTGLVAGGSFVLAAFSVFMAALIGGVQIE